MRRAASTLLMLVCIAVLTGCGISRLWSEQDNTEPPAPLVEFEPLIEVKTLWRRSVGAGTGEQYLKLTPAVSRGRVFAADREGRVRAFDAETGKRLWKADTDLPLSGGPGIGEGLVLVGSSDGEVVALAAEDGRERWRVRVSSEVLAAPQGIDGVVVVRTIDGRLFGLDAADGTRLWIYDRSVPVLTLRGTSAPRLVRSMVLSGFDGGTLVALSLRNAQLLWETQVAAPRGRSELERMVDIDSHPVVVEDTVYVATYQGRVAAVDLDSGSVLWRRDMSSHAGIAVDGRYVYVADEDSQVWALDRFTSASVWRQDELRARNLSSPAVVRDYVAVGDLEGYVHWLRREDGRFAARVRVGSERITASPVADGDVVYVYSDNGTLTALTPAGG